MLKCISEHQDWLGTLCTSASHTRVISGMLWLWSNPGSHLGAPKCSSCTRPCQGVFPDALPPSCLDVPLWNHILAVRKIKEYLHRRFWLFRAVYATEINAYVTCMIVQVNCMAWHESLNAVTAFKSWYEPSSYCILSSLISWSSLTKNIGSTSWETGTLVAELGHKLSCRW